MIRVRVIRASKLVFFAALAALLIALVCLGAAWVSAPREAAAPLPSSGVVERGAEEAGGGSWPPPASRVTELNFPDENEHTDLPAEGFSAEPIPRSTSAVEPENSPAPAGAEPLRVLIYHTHTHEAYRQEAENPYEEEEPYRSADAEYSVVAVGAELARLLAEKGFSVLHDLSDHEPPRLSTAYARSLETLRGYGRERFDLIIDLHRDAYSETAIPVLRANYKGRGAAQLMLLVGNGEGFEEVGDYPANLAFARALTARLNAISPGLCREPMVKKGRYNQHMCTPAILVEAGHNLNTLGEAKRSMAPLAEAIRAQLAGEIGG